MRATEALWQGRTVRSEGVGSVALSWEGVSASFSVIGASSVSAILSSSLLGATRFKVFIDGSMTTRLDVNPSAGAERHVLAAGLARETIHTIVFWYIVDPVSISWPVVSPGNVTVLLFATDGSFGPPVPTLTRRLLIIGDSISAGNQIDEATCAADHSGTYEAQLCSSFRANCSTLALSGFGVYQNCCPVLDAIGPMPALVRRALPSDPSVHWDDSLFVPDAIIVHLGTNDVLRFNGTAAWITGFVDAYAQLLVDLMAAYGSNLRLPVFCLMGPMTQQPVPWIQEAMSVGRARGLENLHFINLTAAVDRCNHPGYASHTLMYEQARPIIARALQWD